MDNEVIEKNETAENAVNNKKNKKNLLFVCIGSVILLAVAAVCVYFVLKPADNTVRVMEEIESANAFSNEAYSELIEIQSEYDALPEKEKKKVKNYTDLGYQFVAYCTKLSSFIDSECAELDEYSYDVLLEYKAEYEKLSDEHKALVTNANLIYDNLDKAKELNIKAKIAEIKSYKNNDVEIIRTLINQYRADFSQEQLLDCVKHLARWEGFNKVEAKLKKALKNPYSYIRESGSSSVSVATDKTNGEYYCFVDINYSATNSFGGRLTDSTIGFANFDLTENGYIIWRDVYILG